MRTCSHGSLSPLCQWNAVVRNVGGDTSLKSATGGPKPVSNPIFIAATSGAKMIKRPMPTRKSRPACTAGVDPTC